MSDEMREKKVEMIVKIISDTVPSLINKIVNEFYSPENGAKIGKGLGEFYKALRDSGIPEREALQMVQDYASNLVVKNMMMRGMMGMGGMGMRGMPWMRHGMMGKCGMHHMENRDDEGEAEESKEEKLTP